MGLIRRYGAYILSVCLICIGCAGIGTARAAEPSVSIRIELSDSGRDRSGISFQIYQVAEGDPAAGSLQTTAAFRGAGADLHVSTAEETEALIEKLTDWVNTQKTEPAASAVTDAAGCCSFSGLAQGMYLVVPGEAPDYGVIAASLLVLPGQDKEGNRIYEETLNPKYAPCPENTPGTPNPTVPGQPAEPKTPSPDTPILGVEDYSPYIGTAMLAIGILLLGIALILLIRRKSNGSE